MCPERPAPSRRGGVRWVTVWLTTLALIAAACSDGSGADSDTAAQASATTGAALQPLEQPSSRCGAPATKATLVRFKAADGTSLDGVLVGSGPAGVVLAHEYPADLCGAWPFADYLSKRGLRAVAIDLRCFGRSACPEGEASGRVVDDLAAAVAELRRRGVTRVAKESTSARTRCDPCGSTGSAELNRPLSADRADKERHRSFRAQVGSSGPVR